ncbi:hypothetical protein [Lonsdalea quercina]|uniref:hypothetical protein n=1 Tax=Lonsdalea quercina TaxID=71657 RepID=UPI003974FF69
MIKANSRVQPFVRFRTVTLGNVDIHNINYSLGTSAAGLTPRLLYFKTALSSGSWAEITKVGAIATDAGVIGGYSEQSAGVLLSFVRPVETDMFNGVAETIVDEEPLTHYSACST